MRTTRHFHVLSYGRPRIKVYVDETLAAFIQGHVRDSRRHTRLVLGVLSSLGAAHLASSGIANDTFFQRWIATATMKERTIINRATGMVDPSVADDDDDDHDE